MLEKIILSDIATYKKEELEGLKKINYFYGSNGTGKTTISKVIAAKQSYSNCSLEWTRGDKLKAFVYNQEFIESNFDQNSSIDGVFTLGKKAKEVKCKIDTLKEEIEVENNKKLDLSQTLGSKEEGTGKYKELDENLKDFRENCWAVKTRYNDEFKEAFSGFNNNKLKFCEKILQEDRNNQAILEPIEKLKERASQIFGEKPEQLKEITLYDFSLLEDFGNNKILSKKIVGKEDIDIAAMIKRLNNSDWVKKGKVYLAENSNNVCPFCQQKVDQKLANDLESYFDEEYEKSLEELYYFKDQFNDEKTRVNIYFEGILKNKIKFLDIDALKTEVELLTEKLKGSTSIISSKIEHPSNIYELNNFKECIGRILEILNNCNIKIKENNKLERNYIKERAKLTNEIWKYLLENDAKKDLEHFKSINNGCLQAIESLAQKIKGFEQSIRDKKKELRELQLQSISIEPTAEKINLILKNFGFDGFSLKPNEKDKSYKLVRPSGEDAKNTLSEGEKTFITFLYFYHLLEGGTDEFDISENRIVVIDDPVSSLDNDILFIVSSLVKKIIKNVKEEIGLTKQLLILTHNVYFFKEVSYSNNRNKNHLQKFQTFWIIRKVNQKTQVERKEENPIKTSYELLWAELKRLGTDSSQSANYLIQNVLRRILEHYFKLLGGLDLNSIEDKFEGNDKVFCNTLIKWAHDGSHYSGDDAYYTVDNTTLDKYLEIFKRIFKESGHENHYKMMMGIGDQVSLDVD